MFRLRAASVALVLLSIYLTGCGSAPAQPGTLRLPLVLPGGQPDPAQATMPSPLDSLLYSGLMKFAPDMHVIPELAVSIPTISASGKTYTFTVRQDARFADGSRCTASDIAFSLARALSPAVSASAARAALGDIAGAEAVEAGASRHLSGVTVLGRLTLRIRLRHPDADFLADLASPPASVVEPRLIGWHPVEGWTSSRAGTGPWEFAGRDRHGNLTLRPRPHSYGPALRLRSLVLVPVHLESEEWPLYHKGAIDAAVVTPARYAALSTRSDFQSSPELAAFYAIPPQGEGAALSAVLNRDALVRATRGALSPLTSLVPPGVPDYVPVTPPVTSFLPPPAVTLNTSNPRDPLERELRAALANQWHLSATGDRVTLVRATHTLPDPGLWLARVPAQSQTQWFRWVLRRGRRLTNDPVTRMSEYAAAETWALQRQVLIPLASENVGYLIKPTVSNLQVTPLGLMPVNNTWFAVTVSR